jgi:hypothetical protein
MKHSEKQSWLELDSEVRWIIANDQEEKIRITQERKISNGLKWLEATLKEKANVIIVNNKLARITTESSSRREELVRIARALLPPKLDLEPEPKFESEINPNPSLNLNPESDAQDEVIDTKDLPSIFPELPKILTKSDLTETMRERDKTIQETYERIEKKLMPKEICGPIQTLKDLALKQVSELSSDLPDYNDEHFQSKLISLLKTDDNAKIIKILKIMNELITNSFGTAHRYIKKMLLIKDIEDKDNLTYIGSQIAEELTYLSENNCTLRDPKAIKIILIQERKCLLILKKILYQEQLANKPGVKSKHYHDEKRKCENSIEHLEVNAKAYQEPKEPVTPTNNQMKLMQVIKNNKSLIATLNKDNTYFPSELMISENHSKALLATANENYMGDWQNDLPKIEAKNKKLHQIIMSSRQVIIKKEEPEMTSKSELLMRIWIIYADRLHNSNDLLGAVAKKTNFTKDNLIDNEIGYAGNSELMDLKDTFTPEEFNTLKSLGLIKTDESTGREYDFFRNRIIYPVCNYDGEDLEVMGFSGRDYTDKARAKYLNTSSLKDCNALASFEPLQGRITVTEGVKDALKLRSIGVKGATASLGAKLTINQINDLTDKEVKKVQLAFDNDDAGKKATSAAISNIYSTNEYLDVAVIVFSGHDISDCVDTCKTIDELRNKIIMIKETDWIKSVITEDMKSSTKMGRPEWIGCFTHHANLSVSKILNSEVRAKKLREITQDIEEYYDNCVK